MPDGLVTWVDPSVGKAGIIRGGRSYVAPLAAVQSRARRVGARVHFEIQRDDGVEIATDVRLRAGKRNAPRHRRTGSLVGSHDAGAEASARFARRHPEQARGFRLHPVQVVSAWAQLVSTGALDDALTLYRPDAALDLDGVALRSNRHIRGYLETLPVFAGGRHPTIRTEGDWVVARWEELEGEPALEIRCRVEDGLISEQRTGSPGPGPAAPAREEHSGPVPLTTVTHGDVPAEAVGYAAQRIQQVLQKVDTPILAARLKLTMAGDPAQDRPATAQTSINLDGRFVGARVAARDMHEAADLLQRRLATQLDHRSERIEALRRHSPGQSPAGRWRHGDLATTRPGYFDRPAGQRQLVRHKALFPAEESIEEAAFDMEQLDYDFYLFRDLGTGEDSLLERLPDDRYRVQHLRPVGPGVAGVPGVELGDRPAPTLGVDQAVEHLSETGLRHVFFADPATGRGCVLYLRYDGHYGLITLG
ncbi:MAG TPA: sigma 54 modulation/S30EA ribosomal C-terminal domain-containing protein [Acidimicrobiales bacterium]|nr:sigma 54 modulation/S30EA ribosomal C-terminal domain-containing protein [Acidimicrobiales bacterium]